MCACVDGMESSCHVRIDGISQPSHSLLSLSHSFANHRKESQNSIHIKIMYKRIYDFKWSLLDSHFPYICVELIAQNFFAHRVGFIAKWCRFWRELNIETCNAFFITLIAIVPTSSKISFLLTHNRAYKHA